MTATALREWQQEALKLWVQNGRKGIVEVATGGGKTVFAQECIRSVLSEFNDCKIYVVVPTVSLADQWLVCLYEELGINEDKVSRSINEMVRDPQKQILVSVLDSYRIGVDKIGSMKTRKFIIVDECHRAGSEKNSQIFKIPYAMSLGLSATPSRQYDKGLETFVIPALGKIVFRYGLSDAYNDGLLSRFKMTNIKIPMLASEQLEYNRLTAKITKVSKQKERDQKFIDIIKSLLIRRAKVANNAKFRIPAVVKCLIELRGKRTIVFHENIDSAERIVKLAKDKGLSVCEYHSKISEHLRVSNLRLFRRGVFDIVVCCHALDEGVNIPEAEVAIIASSTATSRQRIQRLGRVLRLHKGKEEATIITLYCTDSETKRLIIEAKAFQGDVAVAWKEASIGK